MIIETVEKVEEVEIELIEKEDPLMMLVIGVFTPDGKIIMGKPTDETIGLATRTISNDDLAYGFYCDIAEGAISESIKNTYGFNIANWTPVRPVMKKNENDVCDVFFIVTTEYSGNTSDYVTWTREECLENFKDSSEKILLDSIFESYKGSWIPN